MEIDNNDIKIEESLRGVPAVPQPGDFSAGSIRPSAASLGALPGVMALAAPPTPLALLAALRRRYKLAMGLGPILAGIVAVGVWLLLPPSKYNAKAFLQVASSQPRVIFKTEENKIDFPTYQRTQLTVVKSRKVLSTCVERPEGQQAPGRSRANRPGTLARESGSRLITGGDLPDLDERRQAGGSRDPGQRGHGGIPQTYRRGRVQGAAPNRRSCRRSTMSIRRSSSRNARI